MKERDGKKTSIGEDAMDISEVINVNLQILAKYYNKHHHYYYYQASLSMPSQL